MTSLIDAHSFLTSSVGPGHSEDPTDPSTVQAMQIALHIPKADPPRRTDVLEAAAQAVVALCLDPTVAEDPAVHDAFERWYGHLIRKVARRARNTAWERVQELPGITATVGTAQARAFIPSAVDEVPAPIRKLQIKGTELEHDTPDPVDDDLPVIYIDAGLEMSLGKAAAQVGHASMLLAAAQDSEWVAQWAQRHFELHVREVPSLQFRELSQQPNAVNVRDGGFTEVTPGTVTVVALP